MFASMSWGARNCGGRGSRLEGTDSPCTPGMTLLLLDLPVEVLSLIMKLLLMNPLKAKEARGFLCSCRSFRSLARQPLHADDAVRSAESMTYERRLRTMWGRSVAFCSFITSHKTHEPAMRTSTKRDTTETIAEATTLAADPSEIRFHRRYPVTALNHLLTLAYLIHYNCIPKLEVVSICNLDLRGVFFMRAARKLISACIQNRRLKLKSFKGSGNALGNKFISDTVISLLHGYGQGIPEFLPDFDRHTKHALPHLTTLSLAHTGLTCEGAKKLGEGLCFGCLPSLTILRLDFNWIGNDGLAALTNALRSSYRVMDKITMSGNNITVQGVDKTLAATLEGTAIYPGFPRDFVVSHFPRLNEEGEPIPFFWCNTIILDESVCSARMQDACAGVMCNLVF